MCAEHDGLLDIPRARRPADDVGGAWQLAALEWVFPTKPAKAPLPGAKYGAFPAACHYADGTFVAYQAPPCPQPQMMMQPAPAPSGERGL